MKITQHLKIALAATASSALILSGAAIGGQSASADPVKAADTFKACMAKANTTSAMNTCVIAEHRRVDAELNNVYGQLAKKLSPSRKALLVKAEKGWIAYRDDDCKFAASAAAGGSLAPVIQGQCLIDLTVQRTKVLRGRLSSPLAA